MSLAHLTLLENVVDVADLVLEPKPNVNVPERTLRDLRDELEEARRLPCEDTDSRIIGDEVCMLAKAVENVVLHRLDGREERAVRWTYIARAFLPFIRTDVAKHKTRLG